MKGNGTLGVVLLVVVAVGTVFMGQDNKADKDALTKELWPESRILGAIKVVEQQRRDGLLGEKSYQKRMDMLKARLSGVYVSESLSAPGGFPSVFSSGKWQSMVRRVRWNGITIWTIAAAQ